MRVLDIGVGCSCIYPLLGHRKYGWRFLGTDIDSVSVDLAVRNVVANHLEEFIEVRQVADSLALQSVLVSLPCCSNLSQLAACAPDLLAEQILASVDELRHLLGPVSRLTSNS